MELDSYTLNHNGPEGIWTLDQLVSTKLKSQLLYHAEHPEEFYTFFYGPKIQATVSFLIILDDHKILIHHLTVWLFVINMRTRRIKILKILFNTNYLFLFLCISLVCQLKFFILELSPYPQAEHLLFLIWKALLPHLLCLIPPIRRILIYIWRGFSFDVYRMTAFL